MQKSTKAALLSALVFPGVGLWSLKYYWRACIFVIPAGIALWYITTCLSLIVNTLVEKVVNQTLAIDMFNLDRTAEIVSKLADHIIIEQHLHLHFAEIMLITCWLCSIAASYFVGKKIDLQEQQNAGKTVNVKPVL